MHRVFFIIHHLHLVTQLLASKNHLISTNVFSLRSSLAVPTAGIHCLF
jgi:hypothetical protein